MAGISFVVGNYYDFWVLKLNSNGTVAWQKTYGGTNSDYAYDQANSIPQTADGGYIVAGDTLSFGAGAADFWVLKLNSNGTVAWQKTYGGTKVDYANSIQQTADGGYIVAGYTNSFGAGGVNFWVLKLDANGNISFNPSTGAFITDTNITPNDTFATVTDTNATVSQQAP